MLTHLKESFYQATSLLTIAPSNLVSAKLEVFERNIVVHLVPCLILKHFSQKLSWGNISIEIFLHSFDG